MRFLLLLFLYCVPGGTRGRPWIPKTNKMQGTQHTLHVRMIGRCRNDLSIANKCADWMWTVFAM